MTREANCSLWAPGFVAGCNLGDPAGGGLVLGAAAGMVAGFMFSCAVAPLAGLAGGALAAPSASCYLKS